MEDLVQGYDLLDTRLNNYVIQKIFMTYKCLGITVKSEDNTKALKLQFEGIEDIVFGKYEADGVISEIDLEKTTDNMLQAKIENSEDVEMNIIAKKLVVTKI